MRCSASGISGGSDGHRTADSAPRTADRPAEKAADRPERAPEKAPDKAAERSGDKPLAPRPRELAQGAASAAELEPGVAGAVSSRVADAGH